MKASASPKMVPFREVRHFQPDDCLHYETIALRGRLHDWTIPAHRHLGLHQIHLLATGSVRASIDGVKQNLAAPALWMLAPGTVHAFVYAPGSTGQQVTLPSRALAQALAPSPNLEARLAQSIIVDRAAFGGNANECAGLFDAVAREFAQSDPGRVEALNALATLLVLWVLRHSGDAPTALARQALRDALTHRFRSLIELNFRRQQPLTFYAGSLGVTVDHLSRVCRATTGLSALEVLHERIMLEARRRLAYSSATVAAIAEDLGFDDPAYFSRFFAKAAGKSPSGYRAGVADGRDGAPAPA